MKNFRIDPQFVTDNTIVDSNCNSITFFNTGTATVYIKGVPLVQNARLEITGNECELDVTNYDIRFSSIGDPQLIIIRKTYA